MFAHVVADAEELDPVAGHFEQRGCFLQFGEHLHALAQRRVRKLQGEAAKFHAFGRQVERHPVVRQARPGEHQVAGLEALDVVADEGPASRVGDQVQLVRVVAVPALLR
ncbi:hypothetical protein D3C86_951330 [compost metagenome]